MKATVLLHHKSSRSDGEAGFTITELIAGLLLSAILLAGLIDITRRFVVSTERVKTVSSDIRVSHLLEVAFRELGRADPGTLSVSPLYLNAEIGSNTITAKLSAVEGKTMLSWNSPSLTRSIEVPRLSHFASRSGVVVLETDGGQVLATTGYKRTLPFDCQFDTIARECRE